MSQDEHDRRIDYVEFAITDIQESKAFYSSVFGWTFTDCLHQTVVHFRKMPYVPIKNLGIEIGNPCGVFGPQLPVDDRSTHSNFLEQEINCSQYTGQFFGRGADRTANQ